MKKLDKYIGLNFIVSYAIAFFVLIGLRIIVDLFINIDEFAERVDQGVWVALKNVLEYYGIQLFLYYRDFAGMITVVAAAFSLGKLIRNNEMIAVMASGISLKRVIAPIVFIAVILNFAYIIDQEVILPKLADKLVRSHDTLQGQGSIDVWFLSDGNGSLLCSQKYDIKSQTLNNPVIFLREPVNEFYYKCTAQIRADSAVYSEDGKWKLTNGIIMQKPADMLQEQSIEMPIEFYQSDIAPKDIPIRRKANFMDLLSSYQLSELIDQGAKIKDLAQLYAQKHDRFTSPIMNIIMLLISLPILVCREPKAMKSAIMISFIISTTCFIVTFGCKMAAGEAVLFRPELWAWLPVLIFLPVALVEIDAMKT
jgi:lipopolysaccharide export system permease protein